jgi:threonine/homoserine/homoserine lactone efflux protein
MNVGIFLRGLIIGVSVAAPVGAIGVLIIRRALAQGRTFGIVSGLGVATADAIYGSMAAFGLTIVTALLIEQRSWFRLIGGAFLLYLGVRASFAKPAEEAAEPQGNSGLFSAYGSTFLLTLTNPQTILTFAAIFAGTGLAETGGDFLPAALMVGGVFTGSILWWIILSVGVSLFRERLNNPKALRWVNGISGLIIVAFGLRELIGLAVEHL